MEPYKIVASQPGGTEVLSKQVLKVPTPGAGELLVRNTAIGLNFLDVYFRTGLYPWPVEQDLVLGSEAAGVVEAVGEGVTGFNEGDRIAYTLPNNAYQTHRLLPAASAVRIPDGISDQQAAASMLKGLTAHYLIHHSYPAQKGDTVLFHAAAGGVGLIAGQWLKAKGVTTIGTAGGPEKCELAKSHGYDHVVDYKSEDFLERVMEITGGAGLEAVYDSVGNDTVPNSLKCLKKFGSLVVFGQSSGPVEGFQINDLAAGSLRLTRPTLFAFTSEREWLENASTDLFEMIGSGAINIAVNQTYPLEQVVDAHTALESRKTTGSTVLLP